MEKTTYFCDVGKHECEKEKLLRKHDKDICHMCWDIITKEADTGVKKLQERYDVIVTKLEWLISWATYIKKDEWERVYGKAGKELLEKILETLPEKP